MKNYFGTPPAYMKNLKSGSLVWVEERFSKSEVRQVVRLTNTQVILEGENRRFDRVDGWQIGQSFYARHITGLAKPGDLRKQDAAELAEKHREQERADEAARIERKRLHLAGLFPKENVYVSRDMNVDMIPGRTPDTWSVSVGRLSTAAVERLAKLVEEL